MLDSTVLKLEFRLMLLRKSPVCSAARYVASLLQLFAIPFIVVVKVEYTFL